jgi:hypothetical protein
MRKLKLESLQVESFETAPAAQGRGTMYGHQRPPKPSDGCWDTNADRDCTYTCATYDYDCETQGFECETFDCETPYCDTLACHTPDCSAYC